ncbi:MAG: DUF4105 domain-containing protein [bacterium]|nr:DUF4105 domain-containing protein [bacterium]
MKFIKKVLLIIFLLVITLFILLQLKRPSNNRDWTVDQAILPTIAIENGTITINNIRNFTYRSPSDYTPGYYDRTFDISQIETAWFIVEPFSSRGAAHTFVSFGLNDGSYLAVSVEIRKEKGESFSPWKGLAREYELTYVIADEKDVIKLRSNYRKDKVYLYPAQTTPEKARALFIDMITRAKELQENPEFYNTLISTCTTNLVSHVNTIVPGRIPFSWKVLLPAYSDELAYKIGLLDNTVPLEELKALHLINERAEKYADDPEFSKRIRGL